MRGIRVVTETSAMYV